MERCRKLLLVVLLLIAANVLLAAQLQAHPQDRIASCGAWDVTITGKDSRITVALITATSGTDCHGAFRFTNATPLAGFGGYSLELQPKAENAKITWSLPEASANDGTYLVPGLDMELHLVPLNASSQGHIALQAALTVRSFAIDTSLFVLDTALAFSPLPHSCIIPEKELALTAIRTAGIFNVVSERALKADFVGAKQELQQIAQVFLDRTQATLQAIGFDCAAEALKKLIGKPIIFAKLGVAFLTWYPLVIADTFKYVSPSDYASLIYTTAQVGQVSVTAVAPTPRSLPPTSKPTDQEVTVQAGQGWQDSGITVVAGEQITIAYISGQWFEDPPGQWHDVVGGPNPFICRASFCHEQLHDFPKYALIGRIGEAGALLKIGTGLTFVAQASGPLYLRGNYGDVDIPIVKPQGSITVRISNQIAGEPPSPPENPSVIVGKWKHVKTIVNNQPSADTSSLNIMFEFFEDGMVEITGGPTVYKVNYRLLENNKVEIGGLTLSIEGDWLIDTSTVFRAIGDKGEVVQEIYERVK